MCWWIDETHGGVALLLLALLFPVRREDVLRFQLFMYLRLDGRVEAEVVHDHLRLNIQIVLKDLRVNAVQVETLVAKDVRAACIVHMPDCDIQVLTRDHLLLVADDLRLLAMCDGVVGGDRNRGLAHHGRVSTLLAPLGHILIGLEHEAFLHLPLIVLLVVLLLIILLLVLILLASTVSWLCDNGAIWFGCCYIASCVQVSVGGLRLGDDSAAVGRVGRLPHLAIVFVLHFAQICLLGGALLVVELWGESTASSRVPAG